VKKCLGKLKLTLPGKLKLTLPGKLKLTLPQWMVL
jgi:hypothetical protein